MRGKWEYNFLEIYVVTPLASLTGNTEYTLTHKFLEPVPGFDSVDMDRLVRPFAGESQIAPCCKLFAAPVMSGGEDSIELIESEPFDGIVFVCEKCHRIEKTEVAIGSAGN